MPEAGRAFDRGTAPRMRRARPRWEGSPAGPGADGARACARTRARTRAVLAAALTLLPACASARDRLPLEKIRLPRGFTIELWSGDVPGARSMSLAPNGVLFVGTRDEGKVY